MKTTLITRRPPVLATAFALLAALLLPAARAAILTWDTAPGDGAAITDGSGSWNTTAGNAVWNNAGANVAWSQTSTTVGSQAAVFGGGTDGAVNQWTITLGAQMAASSVTFNNTGYRITNSTLQLAPSSAVNGTITVAAGKTASIHSTLGYNNNQPATNTVNTGSTLNLAGGAGNSQYRFFGAGTVNLLAGTYTANVGYVNAATFIQSGGTFNFNLPSVSGGGFSVGNSAGQSVQYILSGIGIMSANASQTTNTNSFLAIGRAAGNPAYLSTLTVQNGTLNVGTTANTSGELVIGYATAGNASGKLDVQGGTVTVGAGKADNKVYFFKAGSASGYTAALTQSGGVVTANGIQFGGNTGTYDGASAATLELSGGALYVGAQGITVGAAAAALPFTIRLQGGTLGANSDWSSPLDLKLGTSGGGVTIRAQNSATVARNITLSGVLSDDGADNGTLTKTGEGTLTLSGPGANTFSGATIISAGTLDLGKVEAVSRSSSVTLSGGAALALSSSSSTVSNLTFSDTGTLSFNAAAGCILTVAGTDGVTNSGPAGSVTVNVTGTIPFFGTYDLIRYSGSLRGTGLSAYRIGATPGGAAYTLVDTGSAVQLVVAPAFIWTGLHSAEWSTNAIPGFKNWSYQGSAADFADGQTAIFDDSLGFGSPLVDISAGPVAPASVTFDHAATPYTLQGAHPITGPAAFAKSGPGTLTVLNSNAYTGPTFIYAGILQVGTNGPNGSLGSGPITDNGELHFLRSDDHAVSNGISGSGLLRQAGSGILTVSGRNTYAGATLVEAGTLRLGASEVLPDGAGKSAVTVQATLDLNGFSETLNGLNGAGVVDTLAGGTPVLTLGGNNASSLFGGNIRNTSGALALHKVGSGTLVLSNASTYGGGTVLSNGILTAAFESALGSGPVRFEGGTRLFVAGGVNLTNPIHVQSSAGVAGRGVFEPVPSTTATLSGPLTLNGNPTAGGHFATTGTGALLDVAGPITATVPVTHRIGTVRYGGGGNGYTNLSVNQGTVIVGAHNGIAPSARFTFQDAGAGTLDLNGFNQSLVGITRGSQSATVGNSSITTDSTLALTGTSTFSGVIRDVLGTGTAKVHLQAGAGASFTLTGTNTYTGDTTVNGSLLVNGALGASAVTVNPGGLLGGTGRLAGQVTVEAGGALSPGVNTNAGRLYLDTTTQLTWFKPGSILRVHLNGTAPGTHDQLLAMGDVFLNDPVLEIALGYAPTVGDQYTILDLDSGFLDGTFAGVPQGGTISAGGYQFQVQYGAIDGNAVVLTCVGASLTPPILTGGGPLTGTSFPLTFSGPAGQSYQVLTHTNVASPVTNWWVLTSGVFGAGPVIYTDTTATNRQQFYILKSP